MRTITVTEEHIKKGKRQSCIECPIALAINDAAVFSTRAVVKHVSVREDNSLLTIPLPRKATSFIYHFDAAEPVEPFSFHLNIP